MKKLFIFLLLLTTISYSYGQLTLYTSTIPASITSSRNYICTGNISMSGTRTISNNATVKIVGKEVTINPGFSTTLGTNVTIEAMVNPALRSDSEYEEEYVQDISTSVDSPEIEREVKAVKVYSITGQLVYSSDTQTNVYAIGLGNGVYVIQKEFDNGETEREKIILNE